MPNREIDDAVMALVQFENGSAGTFEATRFAIGCKNQNFFQIHGAGGMLRFNLERLNHLEFLDASQPSTEQGPRDLLVTDMKHPDLRKLLAARAHHRVRAHVHRGAWQSSSSASRATRSSIRASRTRSSRRRRSTPSCSPRKRGSGSTSPPADIQRELLYDTSQHRERRTASCRVGRRRRRRRHLVLAALDDRRTAVGVDHDQPAGSAGVLGARVASCARRSNGATRSTATSPSHSTLGMMVGQIPAGTLMDRVGTKVGLALIFVVWSVICDGARAWPDPGTADRGDRRTD